MVFYPPLLLWLLIHPGYCPELWLWHHCLMRSLIHHQGLQISYTYLQSRLFTETAGTFSSYLWIFRVSPKCDPFVPWFLNNFYQCAVCANSLQSCPTLCTPMNCTPLGAFVHGILQARMLEWVAMPFSRISSQHGDWIGIPCTTGRFFTHWATWEAPKYIPNFLTNRGLCGQGMLLVIPGNKKIIACHSSSTKVKKKQK